MGDNMYDLNMINDYLDTKIVGKTVIQYDELNSTYNKAKNIFNTCPDGTVVLSDFQTSCSFRTGKEWICFPDKNIYLSIILKFNANNQLISKFDVIGCVSVCKAIENLYNVDCKIKWPNDVLINDRKVCSLSGNIICKNNKSEGIVLSTCINVNTTKEIELCESIQNLATSLKLETSYEVNRERLTAEILNNFDCYYNELVKGNAVKEVIEFYNKELTIINKTIEIRKKGKKTIRKVQVLGIDTEGWLIVINEKKIKEILNPGETMIYEKNKDR